jgi:hypothetical protein
MTIIRESKFINGVYIHYLRSRTEIRPFQMLDDCTGHSYNYYSCQLEQYDHTKPEIKGRQSRKRLKQVLEWSKYHLFNKGGREYGI